MEVSLWIAPFGIEIFLIITDFDEKKLLKILNFEVQKSKKKNLLIASSVRAFRKQRNPL